MPELPEVFTISKGLSENIVGHTIINCVITQGYDTLPNNVTFLNGVKGKRISNIDRIAKNILLNLEGNLAIQIHLAMTGQIFLRENNLIPDRWVKVTLELENGPDRRFLRFCDMRTFGKVAILTETGIKNLKDKYGPEPFLKNLTATEFLQIIQSKNTNIKNLLLDQTVVSGLGNIYATEALFLAGISPETKTKDFTLDQATKLLECANHVLEEGMKNGGSTLGDGMYVDIFGNAGSNQNGFRVYGKKTCPSCQKEVKYTKLNGRGTYFCPSCQS